MISYPGSPTKCCFDMLAKGDFCGPDSQVLSSMVVSQSLLLLSSTSRFIKLSPRGSTFAREWLRHKPARKCKSILKWVEQRLHSDPSNAFRWKRFPYRILCNAIVAFIVLARAVYDIAESLIWEVCYFPHTIIQNIR